MINIEEELMNLPPLPKAVLDFDQFLNEPPEYEDQRMVRDYRHEAYKHWLKVLVAIPEYARSALLEYERLEVQTHSPGKKGE